MANGKRVALMGVVLACAMGGGVMGQTTQEGKGVTLEGVKQQIADFKDQLSKAKAEGTDAGTRMRSRQEVSRLFEMMNTVADALDDGRYDDAVRSLRSAPGSVETDSYREELTGLTESVRKLASADQATFGTRMQGLIKRVPEAMKGAKSAEDLAGLQAELQGAVRRMNEGRMSNETRVMADQYRQSLDQANNTVSRYADLLGMEADGDSEGAWQAASQLLNSGFNGKSVPGREVIQQHLDALEKKRAEVAQKELEGMAKTVREAKTSADLGPVMERLQTLSNRSMRSGNQRFFGEVQVVQTWGRMLDQESQKRYRTAMGTLLELRQRNGMDVRGNAGTLITEEMVTGKMAGLQKEIVERGDDFFDPAMKPVAEGLTKAETLEEMEKGASGVESLATGMQMGMDADLQPLLQELREAAGEIRTLGQMQESIKTREWGRFWQMNQQMHSIGVVMGNGEQHPNRWAEKIERQRMKLVRGAVAESAEFKELKVTAQEDVPLDKTLLEAADAAIKAEDYRRAVLVMEAYVTYSYGSGQVYGAGMMGMVPEGIRADIQGLQLFAEGKSFEAAGDMVSAVAAYRGVVRLTGQRVPLEQATARLTEIGKDNAELLKAPVVEGRAGVPGVR